MRRLKLSLPKLAPLLFLFFFFCLFPAQSWSRLRLIMDTDAKNEIDDQFTITYLVLSNRVDILGFTAEHFAKEGSMEASYTEIQKVLKLLHHEEYPVYRGTEGALQKSTNPRKSDASRFIIQAAMHQEDSQRLILLCTGAVTNVVSAFLEEPRIASRIAVYWLAGMNWPRGGAVFNNKNDMLAAQLLFASDIPLTLIPAIGVADRIRLTLRDRAKVEGKGEIGNYLWKLFTAWHFKPWPLWDLAALAAVQTPEWVKTITVPRPRVRNNGTYDHTSVKGELRVVTKVNAKAIKDDFFRVLSRAP